MIFKFTFLVLKQGLNLSNCILVELLQIISKQIHDRVAWRALHGTS